MTSLCLPHGCIDVGLVGRVDDQLTEVPVEAEPELRALRQINKPASAAVAFEGEAGG